MNERDRFDEVERNVWTMTAVIPILITILTITALAVWRGFLVRNFPEIVPADFERYVAWSTGVVVLVNFSAMLGVTGFRSDPY